MRSIFTILGVILGVRLVRHWGGAIPGFFLGHFVGQWLERRLQPWLQGLRGAAESSASNAGQQPAANTNPAVDDLKTLGLNPGASLEDIEQAWRRLMARYHPDRATETGRPEAERRSREINAAYRRLRRRV